MSVGFFDDILIPPSALQQPARFDEAEQVWVWEYEDGKHSLFMDPGQWHRPATHWAGELTEI